ncbi:hypothetical protein SMACR_08644 [Sordaria macrospora]|uniref:WGS project CABT00000000 data, contig 2.61 n=2 Tax=Sordaria macrospora TaxID=5147 RepID=F7WAG4_SORMK|nr:uncharacterized protein SMAC_08644 [Sordaria macrospora k-hell]KAA8629714.1 hypothetical protein SMACR_08644 [Sordaria macrospora]WPJ65218.1 hypothetical protein SMAC4_08644 [Sordaria macrospora]CCC05329.1 unnamed protein product [Sordaria macrospora k-hell]
MRLPSSSYGQTGLNALFGRADVCDVAFPGEGASTNFCSPSNTLCCVRKGQQYPACQTGVGKGWCCTGTGTSNCYVDQASSCDEPNAVPCTNLKKGVSKACCPRLTSCSDQYEATEEFVRCNIQYDDLFHPAVVVTATISESGRVSTVTLGPSSSSSSSTSSTVLSSSSTTQSSVPSSSATAPESGSGSALTPLPGLPVPSSTASSIPAGPSPTPDSPPMISTGAIAGISVSATLAGALLAVLIWIVLRRRRKASAAAESEKAAAGTDGNQTGSGSDQDTSRDLGNPPDYLPELPHDNTRSEAPGDTCPYSYWVGQNGEGYYKPMELMTERVVPVELQGNNMNTQRGMMPGQQWQNQHHQQYGPFEIMTNPRGSGVVGTPRAELAVPTPRAELGTFI